MSPRSRQGRRWRAAALAGAIALGVSQALAPAAAAPAIDSSALRQAVTVGGLRQHLAAFQEIATANGGVRASGSAGYDASASYVAGQLTAANYVVRQQSFSFDRFRELSPAVLEQVAPATRTYVEGQDFSTMEYSGSGDVTADVTATNDIVIPAGATANTSTSGCEPTDFPATTAGTIALVQRGSCTFRQKAQNAQAAGAVGVIIFNEGQPGRTAVIDGTLSQPALSLPVVGATFELGSDLYNLRNSGLRVRLKTDTVVETRVTSNVIAETPGGRADRVVVVGAHLDSVDEGPGINDNGSGTAATLEVALQIARLGIQPTNKLRFAFWGAEESGLIGSERYVDQLTDREIKDIAVNLNFDMVGSPNFVRFVYDGDGSSTPLAGPNGSATIEQVFLDYFAGQGMATEPTAFDGRSDYGPFIAVGIPAGGLFTGAEGIKSAAQAAVYGGTAGVAYDPCYHQACDTIKNLNDTALDQMSDAIAHAVLTFGMTTSAVNGTDKGKANGQFRDRLEYDGHNAQR